MRERLYFDGIAAADENLQKDWTTSVLNKKKCENLISRKSKYVVSYNILRMKLFFFNPASSELRNKTRAWCGLVVFIFGSDGEYELAQPIYWVEREVLFQRSWALPSFEERVLAGLRVCGFLLSCFVITADRIMAPAADYKFIMSWTLTVTGDHVKFARFALLPSVKEQRHDFHFFVQCIIKGIQQLLDTVFVISRIIKVSVRVISFSLRFRLITLTSTLIILDIAKPYPIIV